MIQEPQFFQSRIIHQASTIIILHFKTGAKVIKLVSLTILPFRLSCFPFCCSVPPVSLLPNAQYEKIMSAFGGKGYFVKTPEELQNALKASVTDKQTPSLINVMINPQSERKKQVCICFLFFFWKLHGGELLKTSGTNT